MDLYAQMKDLLERTSKIEGEMDEISERVRKVIEESDRQKAEDDKEQEARRKQLVAPVAGSAAKNHLTLVGS